MYDLLDKLSLGRKRYDLLNFLFVQVDVSPGTVHFFGEGFCVIDFALQNTFVFLICFAFWIILPKCLQDVCKPTNDSKQGIMTRQYASYPESQCVQTLCQIIRHNTDKTKRVTNHGQQHHLEAFFRVFENRWI
jgi:hypothetical protein